MSLGQPTRLEEINVRRQRGASETNQSGEKPGSQISRIKRCIGATLLTQKIASQECEGVIIANLINLWNAFGKPVCVKNA